MTWWPAWLWGRRRQQATPRVAAASAAADAAYRDAVTGREESARLADSLEKRAGRNAFGESMIELFRGHAGGRP